MEYERIYSDMEIICGFFRRASNEELIKIFGTENLRAIFKYNKEEEIKNKILDYIRKIYDDAKNE